MSDLQVLINSSDVIEESMSREESGSNLEPSKRKFEEKFESSVSSEREKSEIISTEDKNVSTSQVCHYCISYVTPEQEMFAKGFEDALEELKKSEGVSEMSADSKNVGFEILEEVLASEGFGEERAEPTVTLQPIFIVTNEESVTVTEEHTLLLLPVGFESAITQQPVADHHLLTAQQSLAVSQENPLYITLINHQSVAVVHEVVATNQPSMAFNQKSSATQQPVIIDLTDIGDQQPTCSGTGLRKLLTAPKVPSSSTSLPPDMESEEFMLARKGIRDRTPAQKGCQKRTYTMAQLQDQVELLQTKKLALAVENNNLKEENRRLKEQVVSRRCSSCQTSHPELGISQK